VSAELLIVIAVVFVGVITAIVYIAFNRWFDEKERRAETAQSEFLIAPYGELRHKLAAMTPSGIQRDELAMTPADITELADLLDAEVNNGGFDQFFFNSSGDYALETVEALNQIGAIRTAKLVQLACDRFPNALPPRDIATRRALMLEAVSPDADAFEDLDQRFYECNEPILDFIDAYKEKHSL
jgi:hypothetical protein